MTAVEAASPGAGNSPRAPRFAKFVVVGGVAAVANFLARLVFSHWLPYAAAIALAFPVGLVTAFVLNRRFVFDDAVNRLHEQAMWFVIVNLAGLAQTLLVSLLLADVVLPGLGLAWHRDEIAHAIGITVPVLTSFVAHQRFSFRTG